MVLLGPYEFTDIVSDLSTLKLIEGIMSCSTEIFEAKALDIWPGLIGLRVAYLMIYDFGLTWSCVNILFNYLQLFLHT